MFANTNLILLDTGTRSAEENMEIDSRLLAELTDRPILHLYDWSTPSFTYGYFTRLEEHVRVEEAKRIGFHFAKRPTGGGVVFHTWDLAFSFLMPASHPLFSSDTLSNYRFVNGLVLEVVKELFDFEGEAKLTVETPPIAPFCMVKPTVYDVVVEGLKVAGAAQRRQRQGYLHQGTLSLATPRWEMIEPLLEREVCDAMRCNGFAPLKAGWSDQQLDELRGLVRKKLIERIMKRL